MRVLRLAGAEGDRPAASTRRTCRARLYPPGRKRMGGKTVNFAIDIDALHERAARRSRLMANPANPANGLAGVSQLATLAISQGAQRSDKSWTDNDLARFLSRRDRLIRWGWTESEAEALAERLVRRDREGDDDRVSCTDCTYCGASRCCNHRLAGLQAPEIGRAWVTLLQRCPGVCEQPHYRNQSTCESLTWPLPIRPLALPSGRRWREAP